MGIVDISTEDEVTSKNYPSQRKLADRWNKFGERLNGDVKGEFNLFFIKVAVLFKSSKDEIIVEGYRQNTNYWSGPGSMLIEQKRRFTEYTLIESTIHMKVENFSISESTKFKTFQKLFSSNYYQLDSKHILYTNNELLYDLIKNIWIGSKINNYSDYKINIMYKRNSGKLKMKIHRMLRRIYELDNFLYEFKTLLNELKKSSC